MEHTTNTQIYVPRNVTGTVITLAGGYGGGTPVRPQDQAPRGNFLEFDREGGSDGEQKEEKKIKKKK